MISYSTTFYKSKIKDQTPGNCKDLFSFLVLLQNRIIDFPILFGLSGISFPPKTG